MNGSTKVRNSLSSPDPIGRVPKTAKRLTVDQRNPYTVRIAQKPLQGSAGGRVIKKIAIAIVVLVIFAAMIVFTDRNPGQLHLDLAFGVVEPSISLAISMTFVVGWIFGLLCTSFFIARLMNERRRLRTTLRQTESEISRLRNLPIADAD